MDPRWMDWASIPLPAWSRWAGIGMVVVWAVLFVWTFHHLGRNLTDTVAIHADHELITSGPYRFVRHPFYLAFFVAHAAAVLVTGNGFIFVAGFVPIAFLMLRTPIEEAKLIEKFGVAYRDYMDRTPRYWPRVRR